MGDVELVINITRDQYGLIMQSHRSGVERFISKEAMMYAIKNGIQLPQGHGRLIDETIADGLIAEGKDGTKAYFGTLNKDWEVIDFLKTVPTVVEANEEFER